MSEAAHSQSCDKMRHNPENKGHLSFFPIVTLQTLHCFLSLLPLTHI